MGTQCSACVNEDSSDRNKQQFSENPAASKDQGFNLQAIHLVNEIQTMKETTGSTDDGLSKPLELRSEVLLESGAVYFGQWRDNLREGRGIQRWPDGAIYEGEWKKDQAEGKGRLVHSNGDVFDGTWKDDKANGKGIFTHKDGSVYNGEWKDDFQHGFGEYFWADGSKYSGYQENGQKNGYGEYSWFDGSSYKGNWANNSLEGYGIYSWKDGRTYSGEWKNNCMHGKGKYTWKDGRSYEGEYENDKRHGFGIYIWKDGKRYEGSWKEGSQEGKGFYVIKQGDSEVKKYGIFQKGKKVKSLSEQEYQTIIYLPPVTEQHEDEDQSMINNPIVDDSSMNPSENQNILQPIGNNRINHQASNGSIGSNVFGNIFGSQQQQQDKFNQGGGGGVASDGEQLVIQKTESEYVDFNKHAHVSIRKQVDSRNENETLSDLDQQLSPAFDQNQASKYEQNRSHRNHLEAYGIVVKPKNQLDYSQQLKLNKYNWV